MNGFAPMIVANAMRNWCAEREKMIKRKQLSMNYILQQDLPVPALTPLVIPKGSVFTLRFGNYTCRATGSIFCKEIVENTPDFFKKETQHESFIDQPNYKTPAMKYLLLKDFPGVKAGTVFTISPDGRYYFNSDDEKGSYWTAEYIKKYPEWFKKQDQRESLINDATLLLVGEGYAVTKKEKASWVHIAQKAENAWQRDELMKPTPLNSEAYSTGFIAGYKQKENEL